MTRLSSVVKLGAQVGQALQARGLLLSGAESCTGGLVGHILTETPGSSAWYMGGAITYSNEAKVTLLRIKPSTLARAGAVSAECAGEMAVGAQRLFGTPLAFAVTGIAGPGGGTPEKPVGLVYVALATNLEATESVQITRCLLQGNRSQNKLESARVALEMVLQALASD